MAVISNGIKRASEEEVPANHKPQGIIPHFPVSRMKPPETGNKVIISAIQLLTQAMAREYRE